MLLWIATHTEKPKVKFAAPSEPKLKELMKKKAEDGRYEAKHVDLGKVDKEKVCKIFMRKGYIAETKVEKILIVEEGNVRKEREK